MSHQKYGHCPECNYSATPNKILGRERKHHWPHSLECVRCGYRTETRQTWPLAIAAWNKQASDEQAAEIERLTAEVQSKNDQIGKLYTVCNEKAVAQNANERLRAALNEIIRIKDDTLGPRRGGITPLVGQEHFDRGCRMAFYRCAEISRIALEQPPATTHGQSAY